MMFTKQLLQLCAFGAIASASVIESRDEKLPLVDLGYAIHQPTYNPENEQYAFSNIRYAAPPVSSLRFRAPAPITSVNRTVNDGSHGFQCRQAWPRDSLANDWALDGESLEDANERLIEYEGFNEDCLFLDVVVPKKVLERKGKGCKGKKAPVIVWIHGGGYSMGWKRERWTAPDGLIERSQAGGSDGVVYVAINYRVGIFGFVTGGDGRIDTNIGLLDQRLALEWVQKNIHLFGGDADNVTVMGQSSGASSIAYHLTANGGASKAPFRNAVLDSVDVRSVAPYQMWETVLELASEVSGRTIASGDDLAAMSDEDLSRVNANYVFYSSTGFFTFNPTPDGDYVQDWPTVHLRKGEYDTSTTLMLSHTANETIAFLPENPWGVEDNDFLLELFIGQMFGSIDPAAIRYALEELYPPASEATDGLYYTSWGRALLLSAEITFNCGHGAELGYVFYNGTVKTIDVEAAYAIQTYIGEFAHKGDPNLDNSGLPTWPEYGENTKLIRLVKGGPEIRTDVRGKTERCAFWQELAGTGEPVPPLPPMRN